MCKQVINFDRCINKVENINNNILFYFQGVGPTAQRAAVIAAVELPVYDLCKQHLMGTFGDKISNHFISSFVASLGSAVASTPIDVIRVSLGFDEALEVIVKTQRDNLD